MARGLGQAGFQVVQHAHDPLHARDLQHLAHEGLHGAEHQAAARGAQGLFGLDQGAQSGAGQELHRAEVHHHGQALAGQPGGLAIEVFLPRRVQTAVRVSRMWSVSVVHTDVEHGVSSRSSYQCVAGMTGRPEPAKIAGRPDRWPS